MNWRTSCVFCLFIFILMITSSCSSLNFIASGRTPFKISANSKSEQIVEIEGTSDFYFWGFSPGELIVDLEDSSNRLGLNLPSYVTIEQYVSAKSLLYSILTLGLFCPVDYKFAVLTSKDDLL